MDLCVTFVDLIKAFDTVSLDGLCKIMAKLGCPTKIIALIDNFMMACLQVSKMMEVSLNCFP